MEKQFTQHDLDKDCGTMGAVFATDDSNYKIIEVSTLDTLLKQIDTLKKSQEEAYFRGTDVQLDKISGVSLKNYNNKETGEVIVSKKSLEDLLQSVKSDGINSSAMANFSNQIKDLKNKVAKLETENKELKKTPSRIKTDDMKRQLEVSTSKLLEANSQVKKLSEELNKSRSLLLKRDKEISDLKNNIEVERLQAEVSDLQRQLEASKSSAVNRMNKAREVKMKKCDQTASLIINLAMQRYDVETIRQILYMDYSKEVKPATIYRAISVREDEDRERILNLYANFPEEFDGVSEQELIQWFETTRIKKLHLVSKEDFIKKYGETILPERDKFITTEAYFSEKDM